MIRKIAIVASSIHPVRQAHLLNWYSDLVKQEVSAKLFIGGKNAAIPHAMNYKINSKLEKFRYLLKGFVADKNQPLIDYQPQIIHLLTSNAYANIESILNDKSIKLIVSFRGFDINVLPKQSDETMQLTQRIFERADVLHFISEDLKRTAIKMNADPYKCIVIHRSIRLNTQVDFKLSRPKRNKITIVSVARLVWEKGYLYAMEAMAILKNKGCDFEYHIVGTGIDYNMLVFHRDRLNIKDQVKFLGELDSADVKQKLIEADIYLQPSLTEALSLAIIEASLAGLPIVSTEVGGIPEVVENNVSGFLTEACNSENLAKSLLKLINDKELRKTMGEKGIDIITKKFSRDIEIKKWLELYKTMKI